MGVIGYVEFCLVSYLQVLTRTSDLSDAFPHGEVSNYYRSDWLSAMIKEVRGHPDFTSRTKETAKWAREQTKRQLGKSVGPAIVSAKDVPPSTWRSQIEQHYCHAGPLHHDHDSTNKITQRRRYRGRKCNAVIPA